MDVLAVCLRFDTDSLAPIVLKQSIEARTPAKHKEHRAICLAVNGIEGIPQAEHCRQRHGAGAVDLTLTYPARHASQHSKPCGANKARTGGARHVLLLFLERQASLPAGHYARRST